MSRMRQIRAIDTRRSVLTRATDPDRATRVAGLAQVARIYTSALVAYVRAKYRLQDFDADDVVQSFLAEKVLEKEILAAYDPARGRFRPFLIRAFDNHSLDWMRRRRRHAAPQVDLEALDVADAASVSAAFEAEWSRTLMREAIALMERRWRKRDPVGWAVFDLRIVRPAFDGAAPVAYAELAESLGIRSPVVASNLLTTAKRRFSGCVRDALRRYIENDGDLHDELRLLASAVAGPSTVRSPRRRESFDEDS